jgi:ketosteroid isomerase-like protein
VNRWVDYRIALLAVFLGVLATVGLGMSIGVGLLAFAGTLVAGVAVQALPERGSRKLRAGAHPADGNSQAQLLAAIERAVARLDELCASDLVPAVRPQADEAAGLARSAQATARTVARAVDQLDGAVAQLTAVGRDGDGEGSAVGRLRRRREALLERLRSTADQLLDVYGSLVETDATLATSTFGTGDLAAGDAQALAAVSASLDDLRAIASELEATGRQELPPGATG